MSRISGRSKRGQAHLPASSVFVICVLGGIVASVIFTSSQSIPINQLHLLSNIAVANTIANNGADQWDNDETVTTPVSPFSLSTSKVIAVSSLFQSYYRNYGAAGNLGKPVTDAFPINQGWLQFFASGALFLPERQQAYDQSSDAIVTFLVDHGSKDVATGVIRLPLLQALLTFGSKAPIGGPQSPFTYVNLRAATAPGLMKPKKPGAASSLSSLPASFIKEGKRADRNVGHFIPQVFWDYINSGDVSPDGWKKDFGEPLTEALSFTLTVSGNPHHMLVQAFEHDGVLLDQDARNAAGHPLIHLLTTGIDYIHTFGLPTVAIPAQQTIWAQEKATLLTTPDSGQAIAHVGQHFEFKLLSDTLWRGGRLWYHVQWHTPKSI
ncbi:MAG: class A beta-lactamase, partial [Ktedonobacteraceae bacterium]|nr:class A beta-lactamase [Ktedonobacteraceae bacterium]